MEPRQVRLPDLDLLELVGGLVQHGELEVDAAERKSQRHAFRNAGARGLIERDHARWAALDPVRLLEAGEQRQLRVGLGRPLPHAESLPAVTRGHMGVAQRDDRGQEIGLGAKGVAKAEDGALRLALREQRAPKLVLDAGQRHLLLVAIGAESDQALLRAQRPLPVRLGHADVSKRSERGEVVLVAREQPLEESHGLAGAAGPPEILRRC